MKLTLEPTDQVVDLDGTYFRVWQGAADDGTRVACLVSMVSVHNDEPDHVHALFARKLREVVPVDAHAVGAFGPWLARYVL